MTHYRLALESGPKRKKTMVHVVDLLGCIATGPTTEEALARTPDAIRAYLRFLQRHGEVVDPAAAVETQIVEHITEGKWLGDGDPWLAFAADLEPLTVEESETHIRRLEWMRAEMLALIEPLSDEQWLDDSADGRTVRRIVEHVLGAEYAFVRSFGKLPGIAGPGAVEKMTRHDLLARMAHLRTAEIGRLRSLTWAERSEPYRHGASTRTARKVMRRMLEHQWEHLVELQERLGEPAARNIVRS